MSDGKKKQINFLDKIIGPVQRRGGGGIFIAMGEQESIDARAGGRKNYGDLGFDEGTDQKLSIDDYINKMENKLEQEKLEEEDRSSIIAILSFVKSANVSLQNIGIKDMSIRSSGQELKLDFDSSNLSEYPFILQFFIKYTIDGSIILDGLFKKIQPFKASVRFFKENDGTESHYITSSNDELLVKAIYQNAKLTRKLISLSSNLELLMVNRKYFVLTFEDGNFLEEILGLLRELHNTLINQQTGLKSVTYIKCFECGEDLDENDVQCPKCLTKRPICAVCLLDLQLSEKEEVVQIPCCGVYGHKEHILMWIEKAHSCPNCNTTQVEWWEKLRNST